MVEYGNVTRETVEYATKRPVLFLAKNLHHIAIRFAIVHDNGQVVLLRNADLLTKVQLLNVGRTEVVIVVETDFTDSNYLRLCTLCGDLLEILLRHIACVMRMNPNTTVEIWMCINDCFEMRTTRALNVWDDDRRYARSACALQHCVAILFEVLHIDMRMRINHAPSSARSPMIASTCPGTLTFSYVFAITPFGLMMYVVRSTPMYLRPYIDFSFHVSNASQMA